MWIFGGIETAPSSYSAELWYALVRTARGRAPRPSGAAPAALEGRVMCSVGHTLYLFGGTDAGFTPSDKKRFLRHAARLHGGDGAGVAAGGALYHTLTRVGDALFLFGGSDDESSPLDDLGTLDLVSLAAAVGAASESRRRGRGTRRRSPTTGCTSSAGWGRAAGCSATRTSSTRARSSGARCRPTATSRPASTATAPTSSARSSTSSAARTRRQK